MYGDITIFSNYGYDCIIHLDVPVKEMTSLCIESRNSEEHILSGITISWCPYVIGIEVNIVDYKYNFVNLLLFSVIDLGIFIMYYHKKYFFIKNTKNKYILMFLLEN